MTRATTTLPDQGITDRAVEVYVFESDAGLGAMKTTEAEFIAG